jgi:hypothetical protein
MLPYRPEASGPRGTLDDLSNRHRPQGSDEELTPAERRALKQRLDAFVGVMREKVFTHAPVPGPKTVRKRDPRGQGGKS